MVAGVCWPAPGWARDFVANQFGQGFVGELAKLSPSASWQGPIASEFGWHLVLLTKRAAATTPSLAMVRAQVARDYLRLGVEHIWGGIDHLLFVAGLLLLAGTMRRTVLAVTGFTVAHSITLTLAALGWVRLAPAPVEAAIALSILFLAREIAAPRPDGLAARHPILVSSSFGLLHGFGFAAALEEIGLPRGELAAGLLSFNLGVELGQIAFILAALAAVRRIRRAGGALSFAPPSFALQGRPRQLAAYALGIPAVFWFIERIGPFIA